MATDYMLSDREGKAMHVGNPVSVTVHSMPMTNDIAKAFGIDTDREGWMIGQKILDDEVWKRVKEGDFKAFSIGGRAG